MRIRWLRSTVSQRPTCCWTTCDSELTSTITAPRTSTYSSSLSSPSVHSTTACCFTDDRIVGQKAISHVCPSVCCYTLAFETTNLWPSNYLFPSVLWRCWLGSRKGCKKLRGGVLARSEVQTWIRPGWCHCHWLSLASVKSRLVLPFWYRLTWVVPDKGLLNGCVCTFDLDILHMYGSWQQMAWEAGIESHGEMLGLGLARMAELLVWPHSLIEFDCEWVYSSFCRQLAISMHVIQVTAHVNIMWEGMDMIYS